MKKGHFIILFTLFFAIFMPLTTYASDENKDPKINARHAVIFDRNSKRAIYGKKENETCKMASTTKIMTAIVVLENSNLDDIVIVSSKAAHTGGSRLGLSTDDKITVKHLLYGLLLESGNDAAVALAEHVGGNIEGFASMMNKKAQELHLTSTSFVTPHGLDSDNHFTTAYELATIADYALKNETFAKIVKTQTYTITINERSKLLDNTNELLGNFDGLYGVKTGFTNGANRCLVTACKRGNLDIICVVLGCDTKKDRTQDSVELLNYAFDNFSVVNVKDILINDFDDWSLEHRNSFSINKGFSQSFDLYINSTDILFSLMAVKKTDIEKISTEVLFNSFFDAPVNSNTEIGKINLKIDSDICYSVRILNSNTIYKKNYFNYIFYIFKNYCNFFNTLGKGKVTLSA